jgi:hypothetical protein
MYILEKKDQMCTLTQNFAAALTLETATPLSICIKPKKNKLVNNISIPKQAPLQKLKLYIKSPQP